VQMGEVNQIVNAATTVCGVFQRVVVGRLHIGQLARTGPACLRRCCHHSRGIFIRNLNFQPHGAVIVHNLDHKTPKTVDGVTMGTNATRRFSTGTTPQQDR
jgi:hypothetical protein